MAASTLRRLRSSHRLGMLHALSTGKGPPARSGIEGVEHIVAVASGKGGVGKSTTAVNLAVALATRQNLRVGILDADIYGPSIPRLMNLEGRPKVKGDKKMIPLENYRVRCMSMGFLMKEDAAAVWRGPMVMSALDTFVRGVDWGSLDVLVIDMPPGTGDAQLSVGQRLALSGAVIVSTPQAVTTSPASATSVIALPSPPKQDNDIALLDARRGVTMFRQINVPILGIVENMSAYACPQCGHTAHIFGRDGAARTAGELGVDLLGQVPLDIIIRETSDEGAPITASDPRSACAQVYNAIAEQIKDRLFDPSRHRAPSPSITVD